MTHDASIICMTEKNGLNFNSQMVKLQCLISFIEGSWKNIACGGMETIKNPCNCRNLSLQSIIANKEIKGENTKIIEHFHLILTFPIDR